MNSTNQVAIAGALTYHFNDLAEVGIGINRPPAYTMMGSHPYWYAPDRVMADEFFRPGMTSGVWVTGEVLPRLHYFAMLGDNLSQLGVSAVKLTRNNAWARPCGGCRPPPASSARAADGRLRAPHPAATRFGVHYTHSREDRFNQADISSPDNTHDPAVGLDAVLRDRLAGASGVTIDEANFDLWAVNAGFKYRGWALHAEAYWRRLSKFDADGPLPLDEVEDTGWYAQGSYELLPRKLQLYAGTSLSTASSTTCRNIWPVSTGIPYRTRNLKFNAMVIRVRSPVNSVFATMSAARTGGTIPRSPSAWTSCTDRADEGRFKPVRWGCS